MSTRGKKNANTMSYLTCGVPEEVTDVRDDFTERQTLRSKPVNSKKKKNIFNMDIQHRYPISKWMMWRLHV